jgi:hypothetical protein
LSCRVVLRVGAEGGSLVLSRRAEDATEKFVVHLTEMDYGLDELESVDEIVGEADSLNGTLKVMDRYHWSRLTVLELATEWEAQIFAAVEEREGSEQLDRWRRRVASMRMEEKDGVGQLGRWR